MKLKKGFRDFLIRLGIFGIISYFLIPALLKFFAKTYGLKQTYTYQYTYLDLIIASAILIFLILKKDELKELKNYKNNILESLMFTLFSTLFFYLVFLNRYKTNISTLTLNPSNIIISGYVFYGIGLILLGLAIFNFNFFEKFFNSIMQSIGVIIAYFASVFLLKMYWRFFAVHIAKMSALLLRLTFENVSLTIPSSPTLSAGDFGVIIGPPCSGVTSLSMFAGLFALIILYDYNKLKKEKAFKYFALGFIGMYIVAILRVYFLMVIGALISPDLALNMFHNNAGWIFFVIYVLAFWYYSYPRLFNTKNSKTKTNNNKKQQNKKNMNNFKKNKLKK